MTKPKDVTDTSACPVSVSDDDLLLVAYMRGAADAKTDADGKIKALQATVKDMREALEDLLGYVCNPEMDDGLKQTIRNAQNIIAKQEQDHD